MSYIPGPGKVHTNYPSSSLTRMDSLRKYVQNPEERKKLTEQFHVLRKEETQSNKGGKKKRTVYEKCTVEELKKKAKKRGIEGYSTMNKSQLIKTLRK